MSGDGTANSGLIACDIPHRQNAGPGTERLAAFSAAYRKGKWWWGVQTAGVSIVALAGPAIAGAWSSLEPWVGLAAAIVAVADACLLESLISYYRSLGAKIQEDFDTWLYAMDWNQVVVGSRPSPEEVSTFARDNRKRNPCDEELRDWYPIECARIPSKLAVIVCQRANARWDRQIRIRFAVLLWAVLSIALVLGLIVGLAADWTLRQFVLGLVVPALPLALLALKESRSHREQAERAATLQEFLEETWRSALSSQLSDTALRHRARLVQDELFRRRSIGAFVPNWFYRIGRQRKQQEMEAGSATLVEEAVNAGFGAAPPPCTEANT